MSDIFERLAVMSPEEGVKLLQQLFNPMRGTHVCFREDYRNPTNEMAQTKQNKVEEEKSRRTS